MEEPSVAKSPAEVVAGCKEEKDANGKKSPAQTTTEQQDRQSTADEDSPAKTDTSEDDVDVTEEKKVENRGDERSRSASPPSRSRPSSRPSTPKSPVASSPKEVEEPCPENDPEGSRSHGEPSLEEENEALEEDSPPLDEESAPGTESETEVVVVVAIPEPETASDGETTSEKGEDQLRPVTPDEVKKDTTVASAPKAAAAAAAASDGEGSSEEEKVTKATNNNPAKQPDESGAAAAAAAEGSQSESKHTAVEAALIDAAAVAVAPTEGRRSPEQSRRSRSSSSSSTSGSSSSSSSSNSSSDGADGSSTDRSGHNSDDASGGERPPKRIKLEEPVVAVETENNEENAKDVVVDTTMPKDDAEPGKRQDSGDVTSLLKSQRSKEEEEEEEKEEEKESPVEKKAPSRERSPVEEEPPGTGAAMEVVEEEEKSERSEEPLQAAVEAEQPTVTLPQVAAAAAAVLPPPAATSSSSVASSRACSPSLASSSSAQSTPTKAPQHTPLLPASATTTTTTATTTIPSPRAEKTVMKAAASVATVAMVVEKPDSARLTADLQSCKRQLAEVRSKYDVTRKELHATKRKLKRMTVRMNGLAANGASAAASLLPAAGANSPHIAIVAAPSEEDRNRKWREPMILSAMKIKAAMGIQAYKSLIKDGELLLPSLRTITRYLESLRKAGGGGAGAGAPHPNAAVVVGGKHNNALSAMEVDEEDGEDDDEDEEQQQQQLRMDSEARRKTMGKGVDGLLRRTVDHNRNEQQQQQQRLGNGRFHSGQFGAHQLQADIKTEQQDPVSFTASPDINYYQHNAHDDEEDDEDGYQDPTSLLEQSRYDGDGGLRLNGDDAAAGGYHAQQQQYSQANQQQQQTLSQAQIEFLKSMVGFRKKWTPYELRTCNEIRHIIGSREYDSLRKNDGMPLPSVKTLRKYRNAEPVQDEVDLMGRKRKHHEMLVEETGNGGGGGGGADPPIGGGDRGAGTGRLFPFGNDETKVLLKTEQNSDDGHFDVGLLTMAQISFLQTLTLNTKGYSDYELQRSLELKNELGSKNYETLRKQEFLNIPTLAMLTRYEQDNGLEDLSRMAELPSSVPVDDDDDPDGVELVEANGALRRSTVDEDLKLELQRKRQQEEQEQQQQQREQEQQQQQQLEEQQVREQQAQQLELYNRLTQADLTRHPLFDSIAGDSSPIDTSDPAAAAAAIAAAMAAAAAGLQLDLNGTGGGGGTGDDSSLGIFENHSIFDKDSPTFDMSKLSAAHVEFLNTLPENPKRWTQEMINSALDIKNEIGTRDYEILRRQGIPLPAARTLRRHKDIRNKADRAMSEPGEILPASGATAGVVGSG